MEAIIIFSLFVIYRAILTPFLGKFQNAINFTE